MDIFLRKSTETQMGLIQSIIFGLVVGSYIGIAAIGFTLIYGIINMIDFAYGESITIGAFIGFLAASQLSLPLPIAALVVIIGSGITNIVIARIFFTPMQDTGPIPLLLASIGVGFFLRNGVRLFAGRGARRFNVQPTTYQFTTIPDLFVGPINLLGEFFVTNLQLIIVGTAVLVFVLVHLLLTRTTIGITMRALADNEDLARIRGIDTQRIRDNVWILAGVLAGLAGLLIGVQAGVSAGTGFSILLQILAAAILGGAGSPYGAIIGSYIIGIVISLSISFLPIGLTGLGSAVAFLILILVLLFKPSGIAGQEVREA